MGPGDLAIVLHTHMPYVEGGGAWTGEDAAERDPNVDGFGTWPFGEEWLWEAIATSYLPLLEVLDGLDGTPVTLSLTPVLCDQLEAPGAIERCVRFLREVRPESHRRDTEEARRAGETAQAAELDRSAAEYAARAERLVELGAGFAAALGTRATWTSSATHAILPLLATDAGVEFQLANGIASHRRRFGVWNGGFWLPECAYESWLDPLLAEAGVHATCIELTGVYGAGDERHLRPLATESGTVMWPLDRQAIDRVWSDRGYPSAGAYRDYHRFTTHRHRVHAIDGSPYDPQRAAVQVAADARDFVARVRDRVADGGICVCALDTELLGHWWYEGVAWLGAVIAECERQDLSLIHLDEALERHSAAPASTDLPVSSWGDGYDLRTWSGPQVADLALAGRRAELAVAAAASAGRPSPRALRELLALQASDWAFLRSRRLAGAYPDERFAGHERWLAAALAGEERAAEPRLRNLAPELGLWPA